MTERILAIVPAYNEEESLEATIEELKQKAPSIDFVIINDGSTDGTRDICLANRYSFIDMPVNVGLTAGFQAGMSALDLAEIGATGFVPADWTVRLAEYIDV